MKLSQILLVLFIFFALMCFAGIIFDNENIFMIGKTIVFPCILFYYFDQMKKVNYLFLLVLLIFYIADIIIVCDFENKMNYLEILLNVNHFLILFLAIKNIEIKPIDYQLLGFTVFMFFLGSSIQYLVFDLMQSKFPELALRIFLSGILVSIFNSISLYNYLRRNSYIYYYFGFACLCMGLMYAFFNIYKYVFYLEILRLLSLTFKILAYFLFVKYMIAKERRDLKLINLKPK